MDTGLPCTVECIGAGMICSSGVTDAKIKLVAAGVLGRAVLSASSASPFLDLFLTLTLALKEESRERGEEEGRRS